MDLFALLQQMVHLAPGMRLVYRMDFNGMYNDVSQVRRRHTPQPSSERSGELTRRVLYAKVVFFHYPQFQRRAQAPLQQALLCAINTLPIVLQLLPEIPIVYDDDDAIPGSPRISYRFALDQL